MFEIFDYYHEYSESYRENVAISTIIIWITCLLIWGISLIPSPKPPEQFVTSVSEKNQPNCILSAYIMFAKERLNQELLIGKLQQQYPVLTNQYVTFGTIKPYWDDMFPSNKLVTVFDCTKEEYCTNKLEYRKPYLWVGMWEVNTNELVNHACLVYFNSNSVTFKHFVYDPKTRFNYYVRTNYDFFYKRTAFLFQIK